MTGEDRPGHTSLRELRLGRVFQAGQCFNPGACPPSSSNPWAITKW